jgi:hypothetical protein
LVVFHSRVLAGCIAASASALQQQMEMPQQLALQRGGLRLAGMTDSFCASSGAAAFACLQLLQQLHTKQAALFRD